jgi:ketosteroid isomerase-like protein
MRRYWSLVSADYVQIVRTMWEGFKGLDAAKVAWDNEAVRELLEKPFAPDAELRWSTTGPENTVYRGRDGVVQAMQEWVEPFSEYYAEALDYIDLGDDVVVPTRQRGVGRESPVEIEVTHVFIFRDDGLIARLDEYDTLEEASRPPAGGPRPPPGGGR